MPASGRDGKLGGTPSQEGGIGLTPSRDGRLGGSPGRAGGMSCTPGRDGRMRGCPGRHGGMSELPGRDGEMSGAPGYDGRMGCAPGRDGGMGGTPGRDGRVCGPGGGDEDRDAEGGTRLRRGRSLQGHRGSRGGSRRKKRTKDGSKEQEEEGREIKLFFANITSWSEHAVNYLTKLEDHFILVAETHLAKEEGEKVMRSKAMRSWHATAAPASPTGRSEKGTHGGCLALARRGISTVPLASCSGPEGTLYDRSDLSGRVLSVQGGSIQVLVAYFQDGEGFGCKNLELL